MTDELATGGNVKGISNDPPEDIVPELERILHRYKIIGRAGLIVAGLGVIWYAITNSAFAYIPVGLGILTTSYSAAILFYTAKKYS